MNAVAQQFEPLIGAEEASQLMGIHINTLRKYVANGTIPHMKIGVKTLFLASVLDEWRREQIASSRHVLPLRKEHR